MVFSCKFLRTCEQFETPFNYNPIINDNNNNDDDDDDDNNDDNNNSNNNNDKHLFSPAFFLS